MHVLVTGATGRIGVHLTRALRREGHTVCGFALPGDPRAVLIEGPGVELAFGRLQDIDALRDAVTGVDAVYHLAAALPARGGSDDDFFTVNLRGTFDLLTAVRDCAPKLRRFAYASSDTVYSDAPSLYSPIDEDHPRRPLTIYGASKAAAEELCMTFYRSYGIPVTIMRFGGTADADELVTPGSVFARTLFTQSAIQFLSARSSLSDEQREAIEILRSLHDGSEQQLFVHANPDGVPEIRTWGDARDVAEGCLLTLESRPADGETFILSGPSPFSTAELVNHISRRTGYPAVIARLPTARSPFRLSSAKARALLGYQPRYSVFDMVDEATGVV